VIVCFQSNVTHDVLSSLVVIGAIAFAIEIDHFPKKILVGPVPSYGTRSSLTHDQDISAGEVPFITLFQNTF
jgi:hypothetical protein